MAHADTVGKSIDPQIFNLKFLSQMERCQGMIDAFPEVQIPLILRVRYNFELVLRTVIGPVDIDPALQLYEGLSQCPSSQGSVVEPCKEVPGSDVVIERVLESGSIWCGDVQFEKRLLRVTAWTVW